MRTSNLKLLAGTTAALMIGLTAGAQAADPSFLKQQASLNGVAASSTPLPLGHSDVREVQNQLIALGFDPGPADGQVGPATTTAVQKYDQSRGGTGRAAIDSMLLARLKADTGPRLTYEQVAERSRRQAQSHAQASASTPASSQLGGMQLGGMVQQFLPLIGSMIANSNNDRYPPGYYGHGQGYYGPAPGYYGPPRGYYYDYD